MIFIVLAAPKNADALSSWVTGPVFQSSERKQGQFFLSHRGHFGEIFPARVSSDSPRLKAFCRVAPSVLFNLREISAARLFLRASLFNVRTCSAVHARLFICPPDCRDCYRPNFVTIPTPRQ
jgi:hypothetical protein